MRFAFACFALTLLGAAVLASSYQVAAEGRGRRVSPVIYPDRDVPLRFSHVRHLRAGVADCLTCHPRAAQSRSSLDDLTPTEAECRPCHDIDRTQPAKAVPAGQPPARCDACHLGYDPADGTVARVRGPAPNLKFSHQVHAERGLSCARCHGDFLRQEVGLASHEPLPSMGLCLECHDDRQASSRCTLCHLAEAGGFVRTQFAQGALRPSGSLRGADHDLTFRRSHGLAAKNDPDYCGSCHRKSDCVECHEGSMKPLDFHGNDYVTLHSIDARRNSPDCSACHRLQTFCVGCHARSGVSADPRVSGFVGAGGVGGGGFHPPGWAEGPAGMNRHGLEAQRNIGQCASCHRESDCLQCHSAQSMSRRVSPHPKGWAGSRRCEALLERNARMCLRCHIEPTELSCTW